MPPTQEKNAFTETTMPEAGQPFEVIWHHKDGREVFYEGNLMVWQRYIALYGYPTAPRWRYANPGPHQTTWSN